MVDETLQAAFEIKTACDEISRKLLRWHWEQKPGAHSLDALLKHLAQRQKESPDYYDRMPDLSGKTSWQQLDTTLCMRVLLDPEKDAAKPLDLLGNTPHPSAARRACNAVRTARNEAAHAADRTDGTQAAILFNEAIESLEEGYAGTAFKTSELEQYYRMAEDFLSRCGAKKPLASAKAEEEEPRASTRNRNGTKPRSQSRGSGSSRGGNARRTNSGRSAGRGNGSRSRGRKKQRRVHYSRKMAVVLVAAVVLGLVVRAVSGGAAAAGIGSPDPHPADRGAGRDGGYGSDAKQLGHHGHGHWVCQRRAAGAAPGGGNHLWGQHRHHGHGPAAGIPGGGNAGGGAVRELFSLCSGPDRAGAADGNGGVFIRAALCGDGADPERGGAAGPLPGV